MPNWTTCKLTAYGSFNELRRFREQTFGPDEAGVRDEATQSGLDLNKVIPCPPDVDWYKWAVKNWGTKWNTCDRECEP
jgi:hypothetical protein